MCNDMPIEFYVGEVKRMEAVASPIKKGEIPVITSAKYEVKREYCDEIIEEGNCTVDVDIAEFYLKLEEPGVFVVKVTANIGKEVEIEKAYICVKG